MAEIALGVGVAWARRDGAGVVVAAVVPGVAVDVAVPSSTVPAAAFALVPVSALSV